ncbi:MAG: hypothetical protein J6B34_00385 [Clostridia bacterium]|nr:hypothetical protein [Clostridia bacterium]
MENSLPLSFQMALSHNKRAFSVFLSLDNKRQDEVIEQARRAKTKREMQILVDSLPNSFNLK